MAGDDQASAVRASDAERERAIDRLRDAGAEGRLTLEELADRVEAAATAVTRRELEELAADLPGPAASPAAPAPSRQRASSVFGDVRRAGPWTVPERSTWWSFFGDIVLDLREASVVESDTRLGAGTLFGDVELLVPEGVQIEVRSWTLFGDVSQDPGRPAAGAPRIVLTGVTMFGDVRVRARRLRQRLANRTP